MTEGRCGSCDRPSAIGPQRPVRESGARPRQGGAAGVGGGVAAEEFGDAEQAVVLGRVLGAGQRAELDLPGAGGDGQVQAITANCTVQVQVRVSKTSSYVAQWAGEAEINGDGSKVLKITKK